MSRQHDYTGESYHPWLYQRWRDPFMSIAFSGNCVPKLCVLWCGKANVYRWWFVGDSRDHDDVIKWKHFPRNWPFVKGIHRWPLNSPHRGQWRGALMYSLICLNKRLSKQSRRRWFETPSCSLWRHYNDETLQHFICTGLLGLVLT